MSNNNLLEGYKLFVQSSENTSNRRIKSNQFYLTLNSILITLIGLSEYLNVKVTLIVIFPLGIIISLLWLRTIITHKELNSAKFKIINQTEEELGISFYNKEWDILKKNKKYKTFTNIEKYIPLVFMGMYFIITLLHLLFC